MQKLEDTLVRPGLTAAVCYAGCKIMKENGSINAFGKSIPYDMGLSGLAGAAAYMSAPVKNYVLPMIKGNGKFAAIEGWLADPLWVGGVCYGALYLSKNSPDKNSFLIPAVSDVAADYINSHFLKKL